MISKRDIAEDEATKKACGISQYFNTASLFGIRIFITPDIPKMKLSVECPVSSEFRAEIDAWMIVFFGTTNLLSDGKVLQTANALHMNPRTFAYFKQGGAA